MTLKKGLLLIQTVLTVAMAGAQTSDNSNLFMPLGQPLGGIVGPSFQTETRSRHILVGFKINTGDVIDGIVPVFASLRADGKLGAISDGNYYGRKGTLKNILKPGFTVSGVDLYEGLWYGTDAVKQIKVYWKKWDSDEIAESVLYGIGSEKADKGKHYQIRLNKNQLAIGIYGAGDKNGLNRFSLIAATAPSEMDTANTVATVTPGHTSAPQKPQTLLTQLPTKPTPPGPSAPLKPQLNTLPAQSPTSLTPSIAQTNQPANPDKIKPQSQSSKPQEPTAITQPQTLELNPSTSEPFQGIPTGQEKIKTTNAAFEKELLDLVNAERTKAGLKPLVWSQQLAYVARYHAASMSYNKYFDHNTYDKNGVKLCSAFTRIRQFSKTGHAENIAKDQKTPAEIVTFWMKNPGQRAVLLATRSKTAAGAGENPTVFLLGD